MGNMGEVLASGWPSPSCGHIRSKAADKYYILKFSFSPSFKKY